MQDDILSISSALEDSLDGSLDIDEIAKERQLRKQQAQKDGPEKGGKKEITDQEYVKDNYAYGKIKDVLRDYAKAAVKKPVKIIEPDPGDDAVAYTMKGDGRVVPIAISRFNSFYDGATIEEGNVLRLGLTCHESLHQIMTPFAVVEKRAAKMDEKTGEVFHFVHNILEDPAIEHFCPQFLGGKMYDALKFTIKWGYDHSPPLGDEKSAWQQYCNAMIQYGDMGPIRGEFTFPEAKQAFMDTVDLFSQGIKTPKGVDRVRIAARLTEATRHLWENDPSASQMMKKILAKRGDSTKGGEMSNQPVDPQDIDISQMSEDAKAQLREAIKDAMKKALEGQGKESESKELQQGDKDKSDSKQQDNHNTKHGIPTKQTEQGYHKFDEYDGHDRSYKKIIGVDDYDIELGKMIQQVANEVNAESLRNISDSMRLTDKDKVGAFDNKHKMNDAPIPKELRNVPGLGTYKCDNFIARDCDPNEYLEILRDVKPEVTQLVNKLKTIFYRDADDSREYKTSGKYSMKRHIDGRLTARVFEKHREPGSKSDMCIGICIDHSGSMSGEGITNATRAAIVLTEACAKLDIPCYVMGYDTYGPVRHVHYVRWSNTQKERYRLGNMPNMANGSNFDSYSIKYMVDEIMKPRQEAHKLMFVISDGYPTEGFTDKCNDDVKVVVNDANHSMDLVGICISKDMIHSGTDTEPTEFERMYGKHVCDGTEIQRLPNLISRTMQRIVKKWD